MRISPAPTIEGTRIRLRSLRDDDIDQRARLGRWPEINRAFGGHLSEPETMTAAEARDGLEYRQVDGIRWIIAMRDDDSFLGTVRLDQIDEANRSANFAIGILDPGRLGQGLGTEATNLAVGFGLEQLDLHRISLTVLADNARAIAAFRKCGFVVEGRLRQTFRRDGMWHDDLVMAVLKPES